MRALVLLIALAGCERVLPAASGDGPASDAPRAVIAGAEAEAFDDVLGPAYCAPRGGVAFASEGELRADETLIGSRGDYAHVVLEDGARWVSHAPALDAASRRLVMGLLARDHLSTDPCVSAEVLFFGDPDYAIVITPRFVRAVRFSTGRVRELDSLGAMLESCRMESGRTTYVCSLDLSFGEARFDRDGVELTGSFHPSWSR